MVSRCANPECATPLRYLRDGRLFQFEVRSVGASASLPSEKGSPVKKPCREVSHFWLCGQCAATLTLAFDQHRGVTVIPLQTLTTRSGPEAASASV
jgi:hypothetical protein